MDKPDPKKLDGRVAIVTGGTSGIGKAAALLFGQEGASVVLTGRRVEMGESVAEEILRCGGRAAFVHADHTRLEDCEHVVAETVRLFSGVDVLFNNAGIVLRGTAETTSESDWEQIMALNVTAVWRMSRLVIPHMRKRGGGAIVNNASDWGLVGAQDALAYAVTKGAVVQMTRSMALDHAHEKIRVNAVCPGDTFVERWLEKGYFENTEPVDFEQALAESSAYLPMKRFGYPQEIARAVLFLACDDSSFITGAALPVDGGNTAQ